MYLERLIFFLEKYFSSYSLYIQNQRKISKFRRVVGKLLSSSIPKIKQYLIKNFNYMREGEGFTGKNFTSFISDNQGLLEKYSVVKLDEYFDATKRVCYVVVANK
jgi:hypothetical protein